MLVVCKVIDRRGRLRDLASQVPQLEIGLAIISQIVATGDQILNCYILEDGRRTQRPAEAFDGQPMQLPIQALQAQWQEILTKPAGKSSGTANHPLLETTLGIIDGCEVRMALYSDAITQLETFKAVALTIIEDATRTNRLVSRYQQQIDIYLKHMALAGRDAGLYRVIRLKNQCCL